MRKPQAYVYYGKSLITLMLRVKPLLQMVTLFNSTRMTDPRVFVFKMNGSISKCHVRTPMEMWSFKETLLDDWYCRNGIEIRKDDTVLDIGCATGDFGVLAFANGCAEYIGIDPVKRSLELANHNFTINGIEKNYSLLCAAAVGHKREVFSFEDESEVASLHLPVSDSSENKGGTRLQTFSLEQLVAQTKKQFIDVLKLDCEGMEFEILLESKMDVYEKIRSITMEVHLDSNGDPRLTNLKQFLQNVGYQVTYLESPVHKTLGYMYCHKVNSSS